MKISIITVVFNDLIGFKRTFNSVITQTYKNLEFIVIDGGSSDGTAEFISLNSDFFSKWTSGPDKGIYDAMNKGINLGTGEFAIFLNAGDCFYSNEILSEVVKNFNNPNAIYFGRALVDGETHDWLFPPIRYKKDNITLWLKNNVPNHQAMFFPKSYYSRYKYNLALKISSDKDYKLNAQKSFKIPFVFCDLIICKFNLGGISSSNKLKQSLIISKELWKLDTQYYSLNYAIKNQIKHYSKILLSNLFGKSLLNKILKKAK
ncbi:glycosyltransferase family 2 protein [Belliella baltica]|nr:glycosyltransferase family 2 protein [Belliella baltica]